MNHPIDRSKHISPHFSPGGEMIAQKFGFIRHFTKERNNSVYFRLSKMPYGFKDQARARQPGEKCGLEAVSATPKAFRAPCRCAAIAKPTTRRPNTAKWRKPSQVGTYGVSPTHNQSGASALNARSNRSGTGRADSSRDAVRQALWRLTPTRPLAFISRATRLRPAQCRQQRLYFLPLPQGQGSLRPTLGVSRT